MLGAIAISGCVSRNGALESRNFERVHIEAASGQITDAAEKVFAAHGFYRVPETSPQEVALKKKTPFLFRPIKGGNALVWLILEPRATGWDAYCMIEPDNLYPGGTPMRFRKLLAEIKHSVEKQP